MWPSMNKMLFKRSLTISSLPHKSTSKDLGCCTSSSFWYLSSLSSSTETRSSLEFAILLPTSPNLSSSSLKSFKWRHKGGSMSNSYWIWQTRSNLQCSLSSCSTSSCSRIHRHKRFSRSFYSLYSFHRHLSNSCFSWRSLKSMDSWFRWSFYPFLMCDHSWLSLSFGFSSSQSFSKWCKWNLMKANIRAFLGSWSCSFIRWETLLVISNFLNTLLGPRKAMNSNLLWSFTLCG